MFTGDQPQNIDVEAHTLNKGVRPNTQELDLITQAFNPKAHVDASTTLQTHIETFSIWA